LQSNGIDIFEENLKKDGKKLAVIPFNSGRKRQSIAMTHPNQPGMVRIISQGAPDFVLK
jgi:magnesium-transporting ATPase (P-type)